MPRFCSIQATASDATDSVHYSDLSENIYRFIPARLAEKDTQRFHGIDERIAQNDYVDIVRFYYHFLLNYK
ncbi:MAG: hypothetical protein MUF23_18235 [Pirellula sp.]|jgi:carboxypeptidase PM20D1|nr:hypothetical protein [Pirellula sp.]